MSNSRPTLTLPPQNPAERLVAWRPDASVSPATGLVVYLEDTDRLADNECFGFYFGSELNQKFKSYLVRKFYVEWVMRAGAEAVAVIEQARTKKGSS